MNLFTRFLHSSLRTSPIMVEGTSAPAQFTPSSFSINSVISVILVVIIVTSALAQHVRVL